MPRTEQNSLRNFEWITERTPDDLLEESWKIAEKRISVVNMVQFSEGIPGEATKEFPSKILKELRKNV